MVKKEKKQLPVYYVENSEKHSSEFFGAILRYLLVFGKKPYKAFYNEKELKRNILIGRLFKIIFFMLTIILCYYFLI
ncbi:hypothetical protein TAMYLO_330360 [Tenacibaculum amylolyticum]